jgi:hypothetical protein
MHAGDFDHNAQVLLAQFGSRNHQPETKPPTLVWTTVEAEKKAFVLRGDSELQGSVLSLD